MPTDTTRRPPLTRDRVLHAAVALADRDGIAALTMRNLAGELGVEAMSLYHHVPNKAAILEGVVEVVVEEIDAAILALDGLDAEQDWKLAVRRTILTARSVLLQHRWVASLLETQASLSPAIIRYHDRLLGMMRAGGFSWDLAHHALHALGSRAIGFSQELFQPAGDGADSDEVDEAMMASLTERAPNIVAMLAEVAHDDPDSTIGWCDDQSEFEFGLDLLLDGLARHNER